MNTRYLAPAALVLALLPARALLSTAGRTPPEQPPLEQLTSSESVKTQFNRESGKMRAIVVLSQTCPYCLKGATVMQQILDRYPQPPLAVFVVWQPILSTDWGLPRTGVLHRLRDRRVRQYWDADRTVAEAIRVSFGAREQQPACCYQRDIWWDFIAVFPPGHEWGRTLPEPILLEGTVDEAAPAFEALLGR